MSSARPPEPSQKSDSAAMFATRCSQMPRAWWQRAARGGSQGGQPSCWRSVDDCSPARIEATVLALGCSRARSCSRRARPSGRDRGRPCASLDPSPHTWVLAMTRGCWGIPASGDHLAARYRHPADSAAPTRVPSAPPSTGCALQRGSRNPAPQPGPIYASRPGPILPSGEAGPREASDQTEAAVTPKLAVLRFIRRRARGRVPGTWLVALHFGPIRRDLVQQLHGVE
jgi:hypothetical protein